MYTNIADGDGNQLIHGNIYYLFQTIPLTSFSCTVEEMFETVFKTVMQQPENPAILIILLFHVVCFLSPAKLAQ